MKRKKIIRSNPIHYRTSLYASEDKTQSKVDRFRCFYPLHPDFTDTLPGFYAESFNAREITVVQLVVSENNRCLTDIVKCSHLAREVGLSEIDILEIRTGRSNDPKLNAVAQLTKQILQAHGFISEVQLLTFYDAGFNYDAYRDLLGIVAISTLSNYLANMASAA